MQNLAEKTFEPGIEEILEDPIFRKLMQTDRVEQSTLKALLCETANDLRRQAEKSLTP